MLQFLTMSKKKISFVIGSLTAGGAERVVSTLSNQLMVKYEVHIIILTKCEPFYKLDKNIKLFHCREDFLPSSNIFQAIKTNYALYKSIYTYLKNNHIDLVIGFITSVNILTILASRKIKIPCIISERIFPEKYDIEIQWAILRKLLYRKANYLVVQTNDIREQFKTIINYDRIFILKNPIATELTEARNKEYKKENIILNIGRLTNQKAQDLLIKAFANVENHDWKLMIVGHGEKQNEYEELIKSLKLDNKILLIGQTKDIAQLYNKSKIFAFTSKFEGSPNALIEAMHFGLSCVSTDCPTGPSELIHDGDNGFLIPIGNQKKLESRISNLMLDEKLRDKFGTNAMKSVIPYEARLVTKEWIQLFEKLLN